jgi:putative SOS response-associated peptidase YedK
MAMIMVEGTDMCGRYAQSTDPKKLAKEFKVAEVLAV